MFAVGHFALGYLTGKITAKFLKVTVNIPLLFFVSVFIDVDLLIRGLAHRGPTHSLTFLCLLFVPLILLYRKSAVAYFVAALQHTLIGDFLAGGAQILWPVSTEWIGWHIRPDDFVIVVLELVFFTASVVVMFKTKDVLLLFKYKPLNVFVSLLLVGVLLPCVFGFHISVPSLLLIPHIVYLVLFSIPIIVGLRVFFEKLQRPG